MDVVTSPNIRHLSFILGKNMSSDCKLTKKGTIKRLKKYFIQHHYIIDDSKLLLVIATYKNIYLTFSQLNGYYYSMKL